MTIKVVLNSTEKKRETGLEKLLSDVFTLSLIRMSIMRMCDEGC